MIRTPEEVVAASGTRPKGGRWLPWLVAGVAILAAIGVAWRSRDEVVTKPKASPIHAQIALGTDLDSRGGVPFALSRDGRTVAFVGQDGDATNLRLRRLGQASSFPLAGTRGARRPFFSADGEWIAFFVDDKLKKISTSGGAAVTLCDAPDSRGGDWGPDGTIVFSGIASPLMRVADVGGDPAPLTTLDADRGERSHRWPRFLPDGTGLLFTNRDSSESYSEAVIERFDLASGRRTVVHRGGSMGRYLPSGHLVYLHDETVFALSYDLNGDTAHGAPTPVLEGVRFSEAEGDGHFDTSLEGTVVYRQRERGMIERRLVELDLDGNVTPLTDDFNAYEGPVYSPDGSRIAYSFGRNSGNDIWVLDVERKASHRVTVGDSTDGSPLWSPDGRRIIFSSDRVGGTANLFSRLADGTGEVDRLTDVDLFAFATSISSDGSLLLATVFGAGRSGDIMAVSLEEPREARAFVISEFNEWNPRLSPDERWLAYRSNESGSNEYYVQSFPDGGVKLQLSAGGATGAAFWAPDGRKVYYRSRDGLMSVTVAPEGASLRLGEPKQLFLLPSGLELGDLSPDGTRFVGTDASTDGVAAVERDRLRLIIHAFGEME